MSYTSTVDRQGRPLVRTSEHQKARDRVLCDGVQYSHHPPVIRCSCCLLHSTLSSLLNRLRLLQHITGEESDGSKRFLHDSIDSLVVLLKRSVNAQGYVDTAILKSHMYHCRCQKLHLPAYDTNHHGTVLLDPERVHPAEQRIRSATLMDTLTRFIQNI